MENHVHAKIKVPQVFGVLIVVLVKEANMLIYVYIFGSMIRSIEPVDIYLLLVNFSFFNYYNETHTQIWCGYKSFI